MTTTDTTITRLAAEAKSLSDAMKRTERRTADISACIRDTPDLLDQATLDERNRLSDFYGEASDRLDAIGEFLTTLSPETAEDALVLTGLATSLSLRRPHDDEGEPPRRAVTRLLAEIVAFLERQTGTTAEALGATAFGDVAPPWLKLHHDATTLLGAQREAVAPKAA